MLSKELKIDNWIYNKTTQRNVQVYPMMIHQLAKLEKEKGGHNYIGIELSEEILLKCPKIEKSDDYGDQKYFNLIGTRYWFCLDHDDFSFGIYNKKDNQSDVTILQYWDLGINLHQMQNLIQDLTNEELIFNL